MGLQQNLNDIQTNLANAKTAIAQSIAAKGVECSAADKLSSFAEKIDSISGGSTGGTGNKIMLTNGTKFARSTAFDPTLYDTSNVTDMSFMLNNASGLTDLDLSTWNVSNVNTFYSMFVGTDLTSINLSNWDTRKCTNMASMFQNSTKLSGVLDLSSFDVTNVADMNNMFNYSYNITEIKGIETWNTMQLCDARDMFNSLININRLDLSGWKFNSLINTSQMFNFMTGMTELYLNGWGYNEECTSLDLSSCSALTKNSILYIFNYLFDRATAGYTTQHTIALAPETKALLTEDEIAIATNKGFTVA